MFPNLCSVRRLDWRAWSMHYSTIEILLYLFIFIGSTSTSSSSSLSSSKQLELPAYLNNLANETAPSSFFDITFATANSKSS